MRTAVSYAYRAVHYVTITILTTKMLAPHAPCRAHGTLAAARLDSPRPVHPLSHSRAIGSHDPPHEHEHEGAASDEIYKRSSAQRALAQASVPWLPSNIRAFLSTLVSASVDGAAQRPCGCTFYHPIYVRAGLRVLTQLAIS